MKGLQLRYTQFHTKNTEYKRKTRDREIKINGVKNKDKNGKRES